MSEIPSLAGQRQAYVIKQLADFSQGERDSKAMHRTLSRTALNDSQIWVNVAAYVNQLPVTCFPQKGSSKKVLLGETIFREQCSSCHEEGGRNVYQDLLRLLASLDEEDITNVTDYLSRFEGASLSKRFSTGSLSNQKTSNARRRILPRAR